ncbi:MAG: hypothetical protein J6O41_04705, partial [Clostridia bacterium]|nr:hypothetical protein [Clostridia bacterium]
KHINNLEIEYNLYYEDTALTDHNKYYSTTCSFYVDICHYSCQTCNAFSSNDANTRCNNCLSPEFAPLADNPENCVNKIKIPIEGYYFDENNNIFYQCHSDCKYCVGPLETECLKCASNSDYLSEENLGTITINSKIYEYSNCAPCLIYAYFWYTNNNFDDGSVKVCLENSINRCPDNFPYEYDDMCYQNCKNTESENIYGNPRNKRCQDECDNDIFFYENNTCIESCPSDYYYFALDKYCIKKCLNSLYHVREEKWDDNNELYFELTCQVTCPRDIMPYSFIDENGNKYCISTCSDFSYYFSDFEILYNIYYKNTLICRSKSQCNDFKDEYGNNKYVALIEETSSSGETIEKRVCLPQCKEVGQYLLPQSYIDIQNTELEGVDCTVECPDGYANYSWTCVECSSIYYYEYEKNCVEECPQHSFQLNSYPYKCFSSCPDDYPYQDNFEYKCYQNLEDVPLHEEEVGRYCDKTKHLWYKIYNVNNVPIVICLNDTNAYMSCAAVVPDYPYTNRANHECVKSCPTSYTTQNEHTRFCDLDTN